LCSERFALVARGDEALPVFRITPICRMTLEALDTREPRLVIHCFRACDPSSMKDIYIDPHLAFVQSCVDVCANGQQSACFVESCLPETAALGVLPAGFIDGHPASRELLCYSLRRFFATEDVAAQGTGSGFPSTEAWVAHTHEVMSAVTEMVLWGHRPCYNLHTRPAMRNGALKAGGGALVRALLARFCRNHRRHVCNSLLETSSSAVIDRFESFMSSFECRWKARKGLLDGSGGQPWLEDLVLFAYAQTLVVIPDSLVPCIAGTADMARLKQFHAVLAEQLSLQRAGSVQQTPCLLRLDFNKMQECTLLASKTEESMKTGTSQGSGTNPQMSSATGNGSNSAAEGDLIPASQRRTNKILVVWWLASFGAFFIWSRRQGVSK